MGEFQRRIGTILSSSFADGEELYSCLSKWNEDLEKFVQMTVQHERLGTHDNDAISDDEVDPQMDHDSVVQTFAFLRASILDITIGKTMHQSRNDIVGIVERDVDSKRTGIHDTLEIDWNSNDTVPVVAENIQWHDMCMLLRTSKNVWRWYIQLYLPSKRKYPVEVQERITRQVIETSWRSKRFLELLINLLEALSTTTVKNDRSKENVDILLRQGPKYVSQLFFYVTYPLSSNDLNLMDVYHYMLTECNLMDRFLNILTRRDTNMDLRLSIVRNIHNALASFPQQSTKAVTAATAEVRTNNKSETDRFAEWIKGDTIVVTYKTFLRDLAFHVLSCPNMNRCEKVHSISKSDGDEITGTNGELIVEILRCCYALRIGSDLDTDERWRVVVEQVLQLDAANDLHFYDGKLAITCILMESIQFRQYLSSDSLESLLHILEQQVTTVLQENYIDDRAAVALNPILAVLYKSCIECPNSIATTIHTKVFPEDIANCNNDERNEPDDAPKNMSPIDAPIGTLRWKLIQLLTWPNTFVKRLTGELLFLLCHNSQQEFIRRVGIGNAVAILSLKGLIDLPTEVHS